MVNKEKFNKLLLTFLFIFILTFVSAITIYSGESIEISLDKQYAYYSIIGNSTPVEVEVVQQSNNNVTITLDKYSQEDSYEIVFFDKETEVITIYSGGGGGGGTRTIYKDKNITIYKDRNITEYVDKEVEVPGETIETITNETPVESKIVIGILIFILIIVVAYFLFFRKNTNERRLKNNED